MHHTPARRSVPASVSSSAGAVVEHEPGLAVARLGRLLVVDEQAPALHQVDDEGDRLEAQQQVLAAPADVDRAAGRRPLGLGHGGLQRGERQRHELLQHGAGELLGQPLGVGLDLGELGHRAQRYSVCSRTEANTPSRAPNTGWMSISFCWSPVRRIGP